MKSDTASDRVAPEARAGGASPGRLFTLPLVAVCGYLLIDFGRPQNWVPAVSAIHPGILMYIAGFLSLPLSGRLYVPRLAKLVLAFLGLMILHVPFAFNPRFSFNCTRDFGYLIVGAVIPFMTFVDTFGRLRAVLRFWVWLHVPLAIYGMTHSGVGIGSFIGDENDFALALNVIVPYAIALVFVARGVLRRLSLSAVVGVLVLTVASTMSRGGFLGLVCLGVFGWLRSPKKILTLVLVAILTASFVAAAPDSYWKEMETIQSADQFNDTGHIRLYYWGIAWRMFLDNPVAGVGAGNYQYNNVNYELREEQEAGRHVWGRVAHSLYFTLLSEHGILGTSLFAAIVVGGVWSRRNLSRRLRYHLARGEWSPPDARTATDLLQFLIAIDASLVTFLVSGAFISVLYYPHVWLLTAVTAATVRIGNAHLARLTVDEVVGGVPAIGGATTV